MVNIKWIHRRSLKNSTINQYVLCDSVTETPQLWKTQKVLLEFSDSCMHMQGHFVYRARKAR